MSKARNRRRPRATTPPHPAGARSGRPAGSVRRRPMPAARRRAARRRTAAIWSAALLVVAGLIAAAMLATSSGTGTAQSSTVRRAPAFTLPATSGRTVSLASYRGRDIVLYFSEGAGCDACFYQMREFEQHAAGLTRAGITVVPIVMNPAAQIRPDLAAFGIHTPYLTDTTGRVSRAYHVLGKGMHAGLPGHGFVLIDARGIQRWYGEYPSMYLSTAGLIQQVRAHLSG